MNRRTPATALLVLLAMAAPNGRAASTDDQADADVVEPFPVEVVEQDALPGTVFRERLRSGGEGPLMVVIPAGRFTMGCRPAGVYVSSPRPPPHPCVEGWVVTIRRPFAMAVFETTFDDYERLVGPDAVADEGWGRGRRPVINVSWFDAKACRMAVRRDGS